MYIVETAFLTVYRSFFPQQTLVTPRFQHHAENKLEKIERKRNENCWKQKPSYLQPVENTMNRPLTGAGSCVRKSFQRQNFENHSKI
ncbi:MAG: hypothetical protein DWH80_02590 [Planctomycetota bacterium]|nr:MAG: hypothetical protein DWH80_02590 [Planctomycetota bacterium]